MKHLRVPFGCLYSFSANAAKLYGFDRGSRGQVERRPRGMLLVASCCGHVPHCRSPQQAAGSTAFPSFRIAITACFPSSATRRQWRRRRRAAKQGWHFGAIRLMGKASRPFRCMTPWHEKVVGIESPTGPGHDTCPSLGSIAGRRSGLGRGQKKGRVPGHGPNMCAWNLRMLLLTPIWVRHR